MCEQHLRNLFSLPPPRQPCLFRSKRTTCAPVRPSAADDPLPIQPTSPMCAALCAKLESVPTLDTISLRIDKSNEGVQEVCVRDGLWRGGGGGGEIFVLFAFVFALSAGLLPSRHRLAGRGGYYLPTNSIAHLTRPSGVAHRGVPPHTWFLLDVRANCFRRSFPFTFVDCTPSPSPSPLRFSFLFPGFILLCVIAPQQCRQLDQ